MSSYGQFDLEFSSSKLSRYVRIPDPSGGSKIPDPSGEIKIPDPSGGSSEWWK